MVYVNCFINTVRSYVGSYGTRNMAYRNYD
jgi:hypothetical protein